MRIAFTSTSGQGKTTLVNKLKKVFPNYMYFNSIQRVLSNTLPSFGTSENGNNFSQTVINGALAYNLLENKDMIADRSFFCTFAYGKYTLSNKDNDFLIKQFEKCISLYDIIFYIPFELKVQHDNFRSKDNKFHEAIDKNIQFYINKYNGKTKIVKISGTVEERYNKIKKELNKIGLKW